jgi:16S rRNA (guanine(1405)-N(7))-methyltransferase
MVKQSAELVNQVVDSLSKSERYNQVDEALVRRLAWAELSKRTSLKDVVKAVKNKLHQLGGAYQEGKMDYNSWLADLIAAKGLKSEQFRLSLSRVMEHHASTRERLPRLAEFYSTCLAGLPPIHSVLDVACGLNPLSIPWMGLADGAQYLAVDIYQDMISFLNSALALLPVEGRAIACDVNATCPTLPVDLALALKTIPCLEQIDKTAGEHLLSSLQAQTILISFPLRSLGGRNVGMAANYEKHFLALASVNRWHIERFAFGNELVFRVIR